MKKLTLLLASLLLAASAFGQTALTQTTLSAGITSASTKIAVASATGITAGNTVLLVDNEVLYVNGVSSTTLTVQRGSTGTRAAAHVSGSMVLAGPPAAFIAYDPQGTCTNGQGLFLYSPVVNTITGNQWLCSSVTGKVVPGFSNTSDEPAPTTAVASAAGKITPSGPLFHVTGTAAITGFNIPVGFDPTSGGVICAIPDALWTTTNANNFAIASTAVVSKILCWTYDPNSTKFYPAY